MVRYVSNRIFTGTFFLSVTLMLAYLMFSLGGMIGNVKLSMYEVYILFMNSESDMIFVIISMLIAMDYPLIGNRQNVIMRTGWKRWLRYEIVSLISAEVIFGLFIALVVFLLFSSVDGSWNLDFFIGFVSRGTALSCNIGTVDNLAGWVLFSSVHSAFLVTFFAHALLGIICGLVCFIFNMGNHKIYGVILLAMVKFMPNIVNRLLYVLGNSKAWYIFSYFDIFQTSKISSMKMKCYGGYLLSSQVIAWLLLLIVVLVEIIMLRRRRCLR